MKSTTDLFAGTRERLALALQFVHPRRVSAIRPHVKDADQDKQKPAGSSNESHPGRVHFG